jgi:hypothetical protein
MVIDMMGTFQTISAKMIFPRHHLPVLLVQDKNISIHIEVEVWRNMRIMTFMVGLAFPMKENRYNLNSPVP